jgi:hypothetical protein
MRHLTGIICEDKNALEIVKRNAQSKLEEYRKMLKRMSK